MIPINDHINLFRDENSGAIVNCDSFEYSQYVRLKNEKQKQKEEIEKIKNDIFEIKQLLKEIVNGSR